MESLNEEQFLMKTKLPKSFGTNRRLRIPASISPDIPDIYNGSKPAQLFKVKMHQLRMLRDRGYDVSSEYGQFNDIYSFELFYQQLKQSKSIQTRKAVSFKYVLSNDYTHLGTGEIIHVIYIETPTEGGSLKTVGVVQIREIIKDTIDSPNQRMMLISETPLTPSSFKGLDLPSYTIEIFSYDQLSYNPNDHYLVPQHILLTEEQTKTLFRSRRLNASQLPGLAQNDPIVRYFGARPGQVFQILRNNPDPEVLVKKSLVYRIVNENLIES